MSPNVNSMVKIAKPAKEPEAASKLFSWMTPAMRNFLGRKVPPHHRIEIGLREMGQLFNSMDPSPFHEKDLDHDAEEFIESWVSEFHREEPVSLLIHLQQLPESLDAREMVKEAIHHFFGYRARLNRLEFNRLMKQGRMSLMIGLVFLGVCIVTGKFVGELGGGALLALLKESLMIAGTVAMWRPMEIYLYEWWPLRRRGKILEKMSKMQVEVRQADLHQKKAGFRQEMKSKVMETGVTNVQTA